MGFKKRKVGDWCWLYDEHMKERRSVKVLEVIEPERHGFFMEHYLVEATCHIDSFMLLASEPQLKDSKED